MRKITPRLKTLQTAVLLSAAGPRRYSSKQDGQHGGEARSIFAREVEGSSKRRQCILSHPRLRHDQAHSYYIPPPIK